MSPLHYASMNGHSQIVQILIDNHADVNQLTIVRIILIL